MNRLQFIATSLAGILSPIPKPSEELLCPTIKVEYPDLKEGEIKLALQEREATPDGKIDIVILGVGRFGGVLKQKGWIQREIKPEERDFVIKDLMKFITADWIKQVYGSDSTTSTP